MKKLLIILMLLVPGLLIAQDYIKSYEMGDEAARGKLNAVLLSETALTTGTLDADSINLDGDLVVSGDIEVAGGLQYIPTVIEYTDTITLTATEIVGTDAGDLGHTAGAVLVAAPGAGYTLQFVNAVLIYDYSTAAYTGGTGNDLGVRQGTTAVSSVIADADLILAAGDKIVNVSGLAATDIALTANSTLNLKSTAITQPGTAAGEIRIHIEYKKHTTGL